MQLFCDGHEVAQLLEVHGRLRMSSTINAIYRTGQILY
jgi:hypothetical protein